MSINIGNGLVLRRVSVKNENVVEVRPKRNHIFVIDVSGSMYSDIPKIASHTKEKLMSSVAYGETVSMIYFSGKGQYGVIVEAFEVNALSDFQTLNKKIDGDLYARGLTGFKEPLEEVVRMTERLKHLDGLFSLWFMTDGYDNQWNQKDILAVCEVLSTKVASAMFVEYGNYANTDLIVKMAEVTGGTHIAAEKYVDYEPLVESYVKNGKAAPRKRVELKTIPVHGVVFTDNAETYQVVDGVAYVPEDADAVYYLERGGMGVDYLPGMENKAIYSALAVNAQRRTKETFDILKCLGDVRFIKAYANCFGKQAYFAFVGNVKEAIENPALRLTEGYDPSLVPAEDAPTVLDAINILMEDKDAKLHLDHEAWEYSRIGRKTVAKADVLTKEEQEEIAKLTAGAKTPADLKVVQDRINQLANKAKAEFVSDTSSVSLSNLSWNEDRPNVSIKTTRHGMVRVPSNEYGIKEVPSKIYRDFAIIKDGILNTKTLPVSISREAFDKLAAIGAVTGEYAETVVVNLASLPLINRKSVKSVNAVETFEKAVAILHNQARNKVLTHYAKETGVKDSSSTLKLVFGEPAAAWLETLGIRDYGFNPPSTRAESTDVYISKEMPIKIASYSSLPSLNKVNEDFSKGKKLNPAAALIAKYISEVESVKAEKSESDFLEWLKNEQTQNLVEKNKLMREMSVIKFAIIVGQTWFSDYESGDKVVSYKGVDYTVSTELVEKEVNI